MRKILIILLLFTSSVALGQRLIVNGFRHIAPTTLKKWQLYTFLTGAAPPMSEPNWNTYDYNSTPYNLVDSTGASSTVQFAITSPADIATDGGWASPSPNTTSFPSDAGRTEWYFSSSPAVFTFTGLNNAKTYTVKTFHYDPASGYANGTTVTIGVTSKSCNPGGTASELVFTGVAPTAGAIALVLSITVTNSVINAFTIKEEN